MGNPFEPSGTTMTVTPTNGEEFTLNYVTVTPPAWDGGEAIDITLLANTEFHTKMAPKLKDIGTVSFTAEYQPDKVVAAPINQNGIIVITIPNWGTLSFYGYIRSLTPDELQVGERASCSGEIIVTNTVISGSGSGRTVTESGPSWASGS